MLNNDLRVATFFEPARKVKQDTWSAVGAFAICNRWAKSKTYSRRDSQMVTHSNTSCPIQCLCMAERTGCPVFTDLWPYVLIQVYRLIISLKTWPRSSRLSCFRRPGDYHTVHTQCWNTPSPTGSSKQIAECHLRPRVRMSGWSTFRCLFFRQAFV